MSLWGEVLQIRLEVSYSIELIEYVLQQINALTNENLTFEMQFPHGNEYNSQNK